VPQLPGVPVDPVVEQGDEIRVGETGILGGPSGARPHQTVFQHGLEHQLGHLAVGHEALFVFVEVRFLVDLKVVQLGVFVPVLVQQGLAPLLRPVAEHFLV